MMEQLSLFAPMAHDGVTAVCCFDRHERPTRPLEDWMRRLVPDGEYMVMVENHPQVLRPTKLTESKVPVGHLFYHYLIGDEVYAGVFVR